MAEIQLVGHSDIDEIEPLCKRAFYQVGYDKPPRCYKYDNEHIRSVIARGIDSDNHILTKYVSDGVIQGFMAVGVTDFSFYSLGQKSVFEVVWHGDPRLEPGHQLQIQMALLKDMIKRTGDADLFSLTLDSKYLSLGRLVERVGF